MLEQTKKSNEEYNNIINELDKQIYILKKENKQLRFIIMIIKFLISDN